MSSLQQHIDIGISSIDAAADKKPDEALAIIKKSLQNEDNWYVRLHAQRMLATIDSSKSLDVMLRSLAHECDVNRETVAPPVQGSIGTSDERIEKQFRQIVSDFVLRSRQKDQYITLLLERMRNAKGDAFRYHLAIIIGNCEDRSSLVTLIDCLRISPSGIMRSDAARCLGGVRDKRASTALIQALKDDYAPKASGDVIGKNYGFLVRIAAADALRKLGYKVTEREGRYNVDK